MTGSPLNPPRSTEGSRESGSPTRGYPCLHCGMALMDHDCLSFCTGLRNTRYEPSLPDEGEANRDLALCPFCGCGASLHEDHRMFAGAPGYRAECEGDCHAMTCWWHTLDQAVNNWNRRPAADSRKPEGRQSTNKGLPRNGS